MYRAQYTPYFRHLGGLGEKQNKTKNPADEEGLLDMDINVEKINVYYLSFFTYIW